MTTASLIWLINELLEERSITGKVVIDMTQYYVDDGIVSIDDPTRSDTAIRRACRVATRAKPVSFVTVAQQVATAASGTRNDGPQSGDIRTAHRRKIPQSPASPAAVCWLVHCMRCRRDVHLLELPPPIPDQGVTAATSGDPQIASNPDVV